ncbi:LysR family transcriptional regulator [Aggregatilineales bacterium SYSU G02658]
MSSIDLYRLTIFMTVTREGSFNRAGRRLGMTASAVSQHIQTLEARLGKALFERSPRGVTLTAAGKDLAYYGERLLAMATEAERAIMGEPAAPPEEVTLGATPGISVYLMPEWIQRFRSRHPGVTVNLQTGVTSEVVNGLLEGKYDVAFVEGEIDMQAARQCRALLLDEVEQMVVVGRQHPWWGRAALRIEDLNGQSFIVRQPRSHSRQWLEQALLQHSVRMAISAEFDNPESIKRAVANGVCLTVLPLYAVKQEVAFGLLHAIPLEAQPLVRAMHLLWSVERGLSRTAGAFVKQLASQYPSIDAQDL